MSKAMKQKLKERRQQCALSAESVTGFAAEQSCCFEDSGIISPVRMPELGLSWQIAVLGKACPIRSGAVFDHPSGDGRNCPLQRIEKA